MDPKSAPSWKSTPNFLRSSSLLDSRTETMSTPSMRTCPCSGLVSPISDLRNTDLPVPEGPIIAVISPGGRVSVTSCQMFWRPYVLLSPITSTDPPTVGPPSVLMRWRPRAGRCSPGGDGRRKDGHAARPAGHGSGVTPSQPAFGGVLSPGAGGQAAPSIPLAQGHPEVASMGLSGPDADVVMSAERSSPAAVVHPVNGGIVMVPAM